MVKDDRRRVRNFAVTLEMHDLVAPAHLLVTTQVEGAAEALLPTDHRCQLGDGLEEPQCPPITRLNVQRLPRSRVSPEMAPSTLLVDKMQRIELAAVRKRQAG